MDILYINLIYLLKNLYLLNTYYYFINIEFIKYE